MRQPRNPRVTVRYRAQNSWHEKLDKINGTITYVSNRDYQEWRAYYTTQETEFLEVKIISGEVKNRMDRVCQEDTT